MANLNVVGSLGVSPAQMQPGSRFPLQVLGWITSLWAFRFNRSREMHLITSTDGALSNMPYRCHTQRPASDG